MDLQKIQLTFLSWNSKMGIGALFLRSIYTGIITQDELGWVARNQLNFSRIEQATALRLGQLIDSGRLQLGCRI
tara:strand:+ start:245 stop:466 length:222 start_codon:yes stop_codon:yes gene_type:complete